jgi:gas vesicle protein GvpA/GvpJ/GvpM family
MPRRDDIERVSEPVAHRVLEPPETSVLDLLDRLLDKGVMANGDVTLGVAGVDLIYLRLATILCAADRVLPRNPLAPESKSRKSRHRQPGGRRSR